MPVTLRAGVSSLLSPQQATGTRDISAISTCCGKEKPRTTVRPPRPIAPPSGTSAHDRTLGNTTACATGVPKGSVGGLLKFPHQFLAFKESTPSGWLNHGYLAHSLCLREEEAHRPSTTLQDTAAHDHHLASPIELNLKKASKRSRDNLQEVARPHQQTPHHQEHPNKVARVGHLPQSGRQRLCPLATLRSLA